MRPRSRVAHAAILASLLGSSACADQTRGDPASNRVSVAHADELADLATLPACAASEQPCVDWVMIWSRQMPLSQAAIDEVTLAARAANANLWVVQDSLLFLPQPDRRTRRVIEVLERAGAMLHYPSVTVYRDGVVAQPAVLGFKNSEAYLAVLTSVPTAILPTEAPSDVVPTEDARNAAARIVWSKEMDSRPGFFFRRVPHTDLISYDRQGKVWLEGFETGDVYRAPGTVDFVPTPDGRGFVTPITGEGLAFFSLNETLESSRQTRLAKAAYIDAEMQDQYPSVGIIEDSGRGWVDYRVLTSWYEGLAIRDYRVHWHLGAAGTVEPLTPRRVICPGASLSLPILGPSGGLVSARDETTGHTKVFAIGDGEQCTETTTLGIATSKATFSADGEHLVYSAISGGDRSKVVIGAFSIRDRAHLQVPFGQSSQLTIPDFVGSDSILFLHTPDPEAGGKAEFRIVCCVSASR